MKIEVACPTCKSSGLERRARQVKVRIPAGVEDKSRIRLKQRGGAGHNGGPTGDLYVVVHVAKHNIFGRKGRDLTLTVPVTVGEATLGASVRVPTLDEPVTLKIPAGTRHGKVFRVKGRGSKPIDDAKSTATATGDLLVTVDIVIPESLNEDQRKAMEAFNAATNGAAQQLRKHLGV